MAGPTTFTIGGAVSGLVPGANVTLENNRAETLTVTANGPFTFATAVNSGGSYAVTVTKPPASQNCTIKNGFASSVAATVANIVISCGVYVESVLYSFGAQAAAFPATGNDGAFPSGLISGTDGNFYGTTSNGGANGTGGAFKLTAFGVETLLYSSGPLGGTGAIGIGGLIEGHDGNFYGVSGGGVNGNGAIFKMTPAGVVTILYSFGTQAGGFPAPGNDGALPSGLVQATDGNFYGSTSFGGTNNTGTFFKLTAGGVETVLHSFGPFSNIATMGADATNPMGSPIQASDGSFYGVSSAGGSHQAGAIYQITPAGVETVLYSFGASAGDGAEPSALIQGIDGNFYGTNFDGGANHTGAVFKVTPAGVGSVLYSFAITDAGLAQSGDGRNPSGLIQASDGNFYGTTPQGGVNGVGEGTVYEVTPAGVETVLYSFGSTPTDGRSPSALIQRGDGSFYGVSSRGGANEAGAVFKLGS